MAENRPEINQEMVSLLTLAQEKNPEGRSELFNRISAFLEQRHKDLQPTEISLMSDIMSRLINNVNMSVRRKLAERLSQSEDVPLDLIIMLANDQIEVAAPILLLNQLLTDDDLINIIRHKTAQHQLGIASRKKLSSNVCRELVTVGNTKTLIVLLNNHDAKIDNVSLSDLVEKSKKLIPIQPPIIERPDLPEDMAARMYQWVSESLRTSIEDKLNLSPQEINKLLSDAVEGANNDEVDKITQEKSEIILVNKLYKAGRLSPAFLMKSLNQGQSSLFEIAFSKLINVPRKIMRSFLYDRGAEALAISCCAAGIDQSVFLTIFELTREAQNADSTLSDEEISKAFGFFKNLDRKRAHMIIKKWVAEATGTSIF